MPEQPAVAPAPSAAWCRDYEHGLLALVDALREDILLNLRLAMQANGAGTAEVERVLSIAKHPAINAYVEQKRGPALFASYEAMLDAVGCLMR